MSEAVDLSSLPSHLQPQQYGILALVTLFSLSNGLGNSEIALGRYQIALIVLALWYGPSVIKEEIIPQKYKPWLPLLGLILLPGPGNLPLGNFAHLYHLQSILLALLVHYAPDFMKEDFLSAHNKYLLVGLAYFLAPSPSAEGTFFAPYLPWIAIATSLFFTYGTIAFTNTDLGAPILWAYPDRKRLYEEVKKKMTSWMRLLCLILLFHPWTRCWIIPFTLAAVWQYVSFYYRTTSQLLLTKARSAVARAVADAARLRCEANSLESLSLQAHILATNFSRDALATQNIRLGNFYSESTLAWAKLGDFRVAIEEMATNADKLFLQTNDLRKNVSQIPNVQQNMKQMANSVYDSSKAIAREGTEFRRGVKQIQAKTDRFARAAKEADDSRAAHVAAATTAKSRAAKLSDTSVAARGKVWSADSVVEELQEHLRIVEDCIAAGDKDGTTKAVGEMEKLKPAIGSKADSSKARETTDPVEDSQPAAGPDPDLAEAAKTSTLQAAEEEMKMIYAIQFLTVPPAAEKIVESGDDYSESDESEEDA